MNKLDLEWLSFILGHSHFRVDGRATFMVMDYFGFLFEDESVEALVKAVKSKRHLDALNNAFSEIEDFTADGRGEMVPDEHKEIWEYRCRESGIAKGYVGKHLGSALKYALEQFIKTFRVEDGADGEYIERRATIEDIGYIKFIEDASYSRVKILIGTKESQQEDEYVFGPYPNVDKGHWLRKAWQEHRGEHFSDDERLSQYNLKLAVPEFKSLFDKLDKIKLRGKGI